MNGGRLSGGEWGVLTVFATLIFVRWNSQRCGGRDSTGSEGHPKNDLNLGTGDDSHLGFWDGRPEEGFELYDDDDDHSRREALVPPMELSGDVRALLSSFDVDPVRGFLPSMDPLRRLSRPEYQPWEAMAAALPKLLAAGQARRPLEGLPVISVGMLTCNRERMRALLLLCTFAHASVWGNPDKPQDTIPKGIAVPLHALASAEAMPPLMTHTSLVLHNWHRLDPRGPLRVENLACNSCFLGGQDETWFYMITVEIEARGGGVLGALLEAQHAIKALATAENPTPEDRHLAARVVSTALGITQRGINEMREALSRMLVGCHPLIFYQRVRPFLSGWKDNPTLPNGALYEGVSSRRMQFYGGSAAQSTLFPALDAALEVSHSKHASNSFLLEMLSYMPPGHRRLLEHLSDPACPSIRRFVETFPATKNGSENGSEKIIAECGVEKNRSKNGLVMGCSSGHAKRPGESLTSNGPENGSDNRFTIGAVNGAVSNGSADVLGQDGSGLAVGGYGHGSSARTASREELQRLQMRRDSSEDGSGGARSNSEADALREAYNGCLNALYEFRSTHLGIVSSYILQHQKRSWKAEETSSRGDFAGGKGTGGTPLLAFLKPLKEDVRSVLLK